MTQEIINTGAYPNDGRGDSLRESFTKVNNNFFQLFDFTNLTGPNGSFQYVNRTIGTGATAEAILVEGQVVNYNILTGGQNYSSINLPRITITPHPDDTTGNSAEAHATVENGTVTAITPLLVGLDYTHPPTVTIHDTNNVNLLGSTAVQFDTTTNSLQIGSNITPTAPEYEIGSSESPFNSFYASQKISLGQYSILPTETGITITHSDNPTVTASITADTVIPNKLQIGTTSTTQVTNTVTTTETPENVTTTVPINQLCTYVEIDIVATSPDTLQTQSATIAITLNEIETTFNIHKTNIINDLLISNYDVVRDGENLNIITEITTPTTTALKLYVKEIV